MKKRMEGKTFLTAKLETWLSFFWSLFSGITKTGRYLEGSVLLVLNDSESYKSNMTMSISPVTSNIDLDI